MNDVLPRRAHLITLEGGEGAGKSTALATVRDCLQAAGCTDFVTVNVLENEAVRQGIKEYANWPTIPQLYVNGEFLGGSDIMMEMFEAGELQEVLQQA